VLFLWVYSLADTFMAVFSPGFVSRFSSRGFSSRGAIYVAFPTKAVFASLFHVAVTAKDAPASLYL